MSGSSVAAVASIGKMSINAMAKKGYPKEYGVGINLAGCMLASVIPPSILMIVAASTASVSIGQALMAGMVPGVLIGVIYMVYKTSTVRSLASVRSPPSSPNAWSRLSSPPFPP